MQERLPGGGLADCCEEATGEVIFLSIRNTGHVVIERPDWTVYAPLSRRAREAPSALMLSSGAGIQCPFSPGFDSQKTLIASN